MASASGGAETAFAGERENFAGREEAEKRRAGVPRALPRHFPQGTVLGVDELHREEVRHRERGAGRQARHLVQSSGNRLADTVDVPAARGHDRRPPGIEARPL